MVAIYQWFDGLIEVQIWTTTPYPIEVIEGLEITCDLVYGALWPIPGDSADFSFNALSGLLVQILLSYGPDDDSADFSFDALSGALYQVLISYGPDDDSADFTFNALSGSLAEKLVTALAPDEGIEISIDLVPGSSHMTPV